MQPTQFPETTAISYHYQLPINFLMDRYGQSHQHLNPPTVKVQQLNRDLADDDLQAYNGVQPRFPTNLSGLGGVHGPKLNFGSRLQCPQNITRFIDELQKPVMSGLQAKRDLDTDYTRVNNTQFLFSQQAPCIRAKPAAGVTSMNRLLMEEPVLKEQAKMLKIGQQLFENVSVDDGFGNQLQLGGFKFKRDSEELKTFCKLKRDENLKRQTQEQFFKDLQFVKQHAKPDTGNPNLRGFLSQTPEWLKKQASFKKMAQLYIKALKNFGSWQFDVQSNGAAGIDPVSWEAYLIKGRK